MASDGREEEKAILLEIGRLARESGWFPLVTDLRSKENFVRLEAMTRAQPPLVRQVYGVGDGGYHTWTAAGMRLVADDPFVAAELERAADLLEEMTRRLDAKQRGPVSMTELAPVLKCEPSDVRRAAWIVMDAFSNPLYPISATVGGIFDAIRPQEPLWKASRELLLNGPPNVQPPPPVAAAPVRQPMTERGDPTKVFVVHGRNPHVWPAMRDFLLALGLVPRAFEDVRLDMKGNPFVGDVVRRGMSEARVVVAAFTPDERATLAGVLEAPTDTESDRARWQARPNVLFEAGMAMGIDAEHTLLVTFGANVELFSDVSGRHIVRMADTSEKREELRALLETMGCKLKLRREWTTAGAFAACLESGATVHGQRPPPVAPAAAVAAGAAVIPSAMVDDRRVMLLKRWLKSANESEIHDVPQDLVEIEQAAKVPPDTAGRLAQQWVEPPWRVAELRGGFMTLRQDAPPVVVGHHKPPEAGDF